jgi:hypothetical protein
MVLVDGECSRKCRICTSLLAFLKQPHICSVRIAILCGSFGMQQSSLLGTRWQSYRDV